MKQYVQQKVKQFKSNSFVVVFMMVVTASVVAGFIGQTYRHGTAQDQSDGIPVVDLCVSTRIALGLIGDKFPPLAESPCGDECGNESDLFRVPDQFCHTRVTDLCVEDRLAFGLIGPDSPPLSESPCGGEKCNDDDLIDVPDAICDRLENESGSGSGSSGPGLGSGNGNGSGNGDGGGNGGNSGFEQPPTDQADTDFERRETVKAKPGRVQKDDPGKIDPGSNPTPTTGLVEPIPGGDGGLRIVSPIYEPPEDLEFEPFGVQRQGTGVVRDLTHVDIETDPLQLPGIRFIDTRKEIQIGQMLEEETDRLFPLQGEGNLLVDKKEGEKGRPPHWSSKVKEKEEIDLDIDSDNNNGFAQPDRSQEEDEIEDDKDKPGKLIFVNDNDDDGDDIPDFADGIKGRPGEASKAPSDEEFAPLVVEIPESIDIKDATLKVDYSASDPTNIKGTKKKPEPEDGKLRLWLRDGNKKRDPKSVDKNGDFIEAKTYDDLTKIGFSDDTRTLTCFAEGIHRSEKAGDLEITFKVSSNSEGASNNFDHEDMVRVTNIKLQFIDARAFNPVLFTPPSSENRPALIDTEKLHSSVDEKFKMDGAVTDGAALIMMRVRPKLKNNNLEIALSPKESEEMIPAQDHEQVGTIFEVKKEAPLGIGPKIFIPPVPALDRTQITNRIESGSRNDVYLKTRIKINNELALYRPPVSFLFDNKNKEAGEINVQIFKNDFEVCNHDFILRRPPILMVHGVTGTKGTFPVSKWKSNERPFNTVISKVEYTKTSLSGVPENAEKVFNNDNNDTLTELRRNYRRGTSNTDTKFLKGKKIAMTRGDVVAHSQGGMLTAWYIADKSNVSIGGRDPKRARQNDMDWPNRFIERGTDYLRPKNYFAGDIRRFISIGTPYLGTPVADALEPIVDGMNWDVNVRAACRSGAINALPDNIVNSLVKDDCTSKTLTSFYDFQTSGSDIIKVLKKADYPQGRKSVRWHPVVGVLDKKDRKTDKNRKTDNVESTLDRGLWALLYQPLPRPIPQVNLNPSSVFNNMKNTDLISGPESQSLGNGGDSDTDKFPKIFSDHIHCCLQGVAGLSAEPSSKDFQNFVDQALKENIVLPRRFFGLNFSTE